MDDWPLENDTVVSKGWLQLMAMMDHPNIAKVLDAGATETGRPYSVMELVRGIPITQFYEENRLTIKERLQLFIPVCQAIQHAHQKGVIHRDIKPSNVLVTMNEGVPHPMVIDCGVAKAIDQRLTEKTLYTRFAQVAGNPLYLWFCLIDALDQVRVPSKSEL